MFHFSDVYKNFEKNSSKKILFENIETMVSDKFLPNSEAINRRKKKEKKKQQ